jgi:1-acyl-sn-glycerol-3-phosphate acyltransferase
MSMIFLLKLLRTLIFYYFLIVSSLLIIPLLFLCALLPESVRYRNKVYFFLSRCWHQAILRGAGTTYVIHNRVKLKRVLETPAVIIANHPSSLDASVIESLLGNTPHLWLLKKEICSIPLLGFILKRLNLIIERGSPKEVALSIINGTKTAEKNKSHIVLFPEGTRTDNQTIYPFKKGFLFMAEKMKRPIVYIGLFSAKPLFQKGSFFACAWKNSIDIVIETEYNYTDKKSEDAVLKKIHDWYVEQHTLYNRTRRYSS